MRLTEWNIDVQRVVLRCAGSSHAMPMGAVVATARLNECMQAVAGPDSSGLVECRGFGELGDEPEYDATVTTDPYGDFSVGRWLWVFQDLRREEPISINGRQGVWTLPAAIGTQLESE